jgi:hypothetical protein
MAALSVAYHGAAPAVCQAFTEGMRQLPPERASKYHEHAYNMSPLAVQRILEQLMTSDTWPVYTPFAKEHFGRGKKEGKAEGKAEGEADAILLVLRARSMDVSDADRERITSCTNLKQLKKWITRAVTAEKTSDLFELHSGRRPDRSTRRQTRRSGRLAHCSGDRHHATRSPSSAWTGRQFHAHRLQPRRQGHGVAVVAAGRYPVASGYRVPDDIRPLNGGEITHDVLRTRARWSECGLIRTGTHPASAARPAASDDFTNALLPMSALLIFSRYPVPSDQSIGAPGVKPCGWCRLEGARFTRPQRETECCGEARVQVPAPAHQEAGGRTWRLPGGHPPALQRRTGRTAGGVADGPPQDHLLQPGRAAKGDQGR